MLAVAATVPVLAQQLPLADVARKEKERREAIEEKSKVYTNDDLRGGARLTTGTSAEIRAEAQAPDTAASTASPETSPDDGEEPERDETYWRGLVTAARNARQRAELVAAALQNRVDGLWAEFTARDDPFQRSVIEQDRLDALEELESTQADMERLDREIRGIEEDARRAGVPPGWLR